MIESMSRQVMQGWKRKMRSHVQLPLISIIGKALCCHLNLMASFALPLTSYNQKALHSLLYHMANSALLLILLVCFALPSMTISMVDKYLARQKRLLQSHGLFFYLTLFFFLPLNYESIAILITCW